MKRDSFIRLALALLLLAAALAPAGPAAAGGAAPAAAPAPAPQANSIGVNGFFSVDRAQQGSSFQAAVVMDIPGGLHVNANRPLGKYSVPTVVKVDAPRGFRVTPVTYPRGSVRTFSFGGSDATRIAVYEGRAIFRFNVSVPANQPFGVENVRVSVRFQSCTDEVCYPPATRNLDLHIPVVGRDAASNRVNGQYFGGGGGRRRK
ncbi:MAG TPA: protein-disulfide reductase DsbD N-terminal domain-containing protein [Pyrinomonadaceae bacterium]|jgi:DsbC/DsbD-like thiol-disulfide interchange protein